jgi:hypothetical protein
MSEHKWSYLYVVETNNHAKIYITFRPDGDIDMIRDANPTPVSVVLVIRFALEENAERAKEYLIKRFQEFRKPNDWYRINPYNFVILALRPMATGCELCATGDPCFIHDV